MHIAVVGGRNYNDYLFLSETLDMELKIIKEYLDHSEITIVSADCEGVDSMAQSYAKLNGYKYLWIPIRWNKFGGDAWEVANGEIATVANYIIAFWNYESLGTKHMLSLAIEQSIDTEIYTVKY